MRKGSFLMMCFTVLLLLCSLIGVMTLNVGATTTELTITTKTQKFMAGDIPSSTLEDVTVEGLLEGHAVDAGSLQLVISGHDLDVDTQALKIKDSAGNDVTASYSIHVVKGKCHIFSSEWAERDGEHFQLCFDNDCQERINVQPHAFDGVCDNSCNICLVRRETPEHTWSEGVTEREPTFKKEGMLVYTCTVCGAEKGEDIPTKSVWPIIVIVAAAVVAVGVGGFFVFRVLQKKKVKEETSDTEA